MKLFEAYQCKNLNLKNRLVMPPMCTYQALSEDGQATSFHLAHYISRALGQTGLIIVEATGVSPNGRISDKCLGLYNDQQIQGLKKIVEGVHFQGSQIAIQLNHAGRKSITKNLTHVGPTAIAFNDRILDYQELTIDEIKLIIDQFKEAAKRAHLAGFDAIEIHAAHGYLINQFISPLSNKRTDEYGQDRFLFLKEIIESIKTVWPNDKAILLRISASDYHHEGIQVSDWIEFLNSNPKLVDIVHVSSGGVISVQIKTYPGYQLDFAKEIREKTAYPTIGVGLLNQAEMILSSLELGYCDLVACGRELLRNPNLLLHIAHQYHQENIIPEVYNRAFR